MKLACLPHRPRAGYALVIVLVFLGVAMIVLSTAMSWTSTTAQLTARNNQRWETLYAAEAATEIVVGQIAYDYHNGSQADVYNNLATYRTLVPSSSQNPFWTNYTFGDANGVSGVTAVNNSAAWAYTVLDSQYAGLFGYAATYTIISNARRNNAPYDITSAVKQDVQITTIPIFQFAIFYGMDMEISCGQAFNVTGRVHANGNLYTCPDSVLTFFSDVTAVGTINFGRAPGDARGAPSGSVTFQADKDAKASSLTLPIGTNNSAQAVQAILDVPPAGESPTSLMGKQRYYNKADLILQVSDTVNTNTFLSTNTSFTTNKVGKVTTIVTNTATITNFTYITNLVLAGKSGSYNNFATSVPTNLLQQFVVLTNKFMDAREGKTVESVDIDVGCLRTNTGLFNALGRTVNQLYVQDDRRASILTNTEMSAVRLVNGAALPTNGLSVATAEPLYIRGNYNAPTAALGTTNTSQTMPASVVADAVTILSPAWTDANSTLALASRAATAVTVNTAIIAGIVPTTNFMSYSGGAENFPRFLEDWAPGGTKRIVTYNGSMVVMFPSRYANSKWGTGNVYNPPARNWAFDLNFMDPVKLPFGTPLLSTMIRGQWAEAAPRRPAN